MKLASDIEAVGFYDDVHSVHDIHCLCSIDIETDDVYLFHDHPHFDESESCVDEYDEMFYTIPKCTGTLQEGIEWWEEQTLGGKRSSHAQRSYIRQSYHQ